MEGAFSRHHIIASVVYCVLANASVFEFAGCQMILTSRQLLFEGFESQEIRIH
jgi:hypothetical protein